MEFNNFVSSFRKGEENLITKKHKILAGAQNILPPINTSLLIDATIAVRNINQQNQFGVIESNGIEVKDIIEKPVMKIPVNAGIYVLNKNLIKRIPKNKSMDMTNFLLNLKKNKKKVIIFPIHEVWKDIGRPSDIKKK